MCFGSLQQHSRRQQLVQVVQTVLLAALAARVCGWPGWLVLAGGTAAATAWCVGANRCDGIGAQDPQGKGMSGAKAGAAAVASRAPSSPGPRLAAVCSPVGLLALTWTCGLPSHRPARWWVSLPDPLGPFRRAGRMLRRRTARAFGRRVSIMACGPGEAGGCGERGAGGAGARGGDGGAGQVGVRANCATAPPTPCLHRRLQPRDSVCTHRPADRGACKRATAPRKPHRASTSAPQAPRGNRQRGAPPRPAAPPAPAPPAGRRGACRPPAAAGAASWWGAGTTGTGRRRRSLMTGRTRR